MVLRAQDALNQVRKLVAAGALPLMRLDKAQDDLEDALDGTLLKQNLYSKDLLPEQTDQMIAVAERIVVRRERALNRMRELVAAGVIAPSGLRLKPPQLWTWPVRSRISILPRSAPNW